jgi:cell division protein ZapA (FtsZ GTPase activity inhibitor)
VIGLEHLVTIELFGQPYTFKSDTDVAKANEAAELLLNEVQKVQTQHSGPSTYMPKLTIMILAALNIANSIMQLKKNGEFVDLTAERLSALNRKLDESLLQLQGFRQYG